MAELVFLNSQRATDWEGLALPGARAFFYLSGTTTPATVYADAALETPHPTPLEADALGAFPAVWSDESLRLIVQDTDGQVLPGYPIDPVPKGAGTGNGASAVSFEPTPEIAAANVQEAVEAVQANIPLALQGVGLGNTGNLPSLTPNNVDNAAIPGGFYTLNTATGGALPAGLTGDGGLFWVNRLSAALAIAWIFYPATGRMFFRTQNSTWSGAWRETNAVANDSFWTAGVSTVAREVSPAQVRAAAVAAMPLTKVYTSAQQAVTSGGLLTLPHGLGETPKLVQCELVRVGSAVGGYEIGDRVVVSATQHFVPGTNRGFVLLVDGTNILVRFGSDILVFEFARKDTGDRATYSNAGWELVVRAWA
jgi:hypothetical protein